MTTLEVDFVESSGEILLSLRGAVTVSSSDLFTSFWRSLSNSGDVATGFLVDATTFASNFDWCRNVWQRADRSLSITVAARENLASRNSLRAEFRALLEFGPATSYEGKVFEPASRPLTLSQRSNVIALLGMRNGANFSVPGAGKTATTLSAWATLRSEGKVDRLFVVCPKSAFESWRSESRLFDLEETHFQVFEGRPLAGNIQIVVCNYEQLQNEANLETVSVWLKLGRAHVVLDESHRVKAGPDSVRWRACRKLVEDAARVDLLSGTPMPQSLADVRNQFRLSWRGLSPNDLNDAIVLQMKRGNVFVRTTKSELKLPKVSLHLVQDEMTQLHSAIYSALSRRYRGLLQLKPRDEADLRRRGRAVMTLLACASNPGLLNAKENRLALLGFKWPVEGYDLSDDLMLKIEQYAATEIPWKFVWLVAFIERQARLGRKTIVWTNFVGNIVALQVLLATFSPAVVFGEVGQRERDAEIRRFRSSADCAVLITNPQTLGEGISLHDVCHDAVYVDRSFNAGLFLQSQDRIHRLGLAPDTETNITVLGSLGTIDSSVELRLSAKVARLGALMEDDGLVASSAATPYDFEEDKLGFADLLDLTEEDLATLFEHLPRNTRK